MMTRRAAPELRHIVDVDGRLLGIDPPSVTARQLLARAGLPVDRDLVVVTGCGEVPIRAEQAIVLAEHEVLFFRSSASARFGSALPLAA